MMAYVFSGLVIAGIILYCALCIVGLVWGIVNDHRSSAASRSRC